MVSLSGLIGDSGEAERDLWLFDLANGMSSRFTFDSGNQYNPTWSPDGNWVAFTSTLKGPSGIYRKAATGTGEAEPLLESSEGAGVVDWSSDGRLILYG